MSLLEDINQLRSHLSVRKIENYDFRLKNGEKKREIEKDEVLRSLQDLGFESVISYKESGQPYLENYSGFFLSISHSNGWIAVYVSERPVGIDIETENPRMVEGASYFLNEKEQKYKSDVNTLHIIWGAKEAFYKWKEGKIKDLKNDVTILTVAKNTVIIEFQGSIDAFDWFQEDGITIVLN